MEVERGTGDNRGFDVEIVEVLSSIGNADLDSLRT